ncbi:hypothetical protein [Pseudomonas sp. TE3610]
MQQVKNASSTQPTRTGVTPVTSSKPTLTWISPADHDIFSLTTDAALPEILFEFASSFTGEYTWTWTLQWAARVCGPNYGPRQGRCVKLFQESESFTSSAKRWQFELGGKVLGGVLTVQVKVDNEVLSRSVLIKGQNPSQQQIRDYIDTLDELSDFDDMFASEIKQRHFSDLDDEPVVTLDQRYGITHMAHWMPSYEQAWNWKANVLAGSEAFQEKVLIARDYLSLEGYAYTEEQLRNETLSRWRGGIFYRWDRVNREWVPRKKLIDNIALAKSAALHSELSSDPESPVHEPGGGLLDKGCCADYVADK